MSMTALLRPESTVTDLPAVPHRVAPHRAVLRGEQVASLRRSLESIVEEFESNRIELVATLGVIPAAAYDAGVRCAVRESLDDIEAGRYGDCQACREPIGVDRLRGVPYARRCAYCQLVEEARWNQTERMVASVVRTRIGEPQGRAPILSCDDPVPASTRGAW